MSELSLGTLYEVNQNIIAQQKPMDPILVNKRITRIANYMKSGYWMLFCPEVRQYVVIHIVNSENTEKVLRDILENRGIVIDIDSTHEDEQIWEFWLKDKFRSDADRPVMYQLTPYEVVEV